MRNKTRWFFLIATIILITSFQAYAADTFYKKSISVTYRQIQVYVDGKKVLGEEPFILDSQGIVMVPVRTVAEATGKSVAWDEKKNMIYIDHISQDRQESQKVTITQGIQRQSILVTYRNIQILADGKEVRGEEPFVVDRTGIVMVPLRAIVSATGKSVAWDAKKNAVYVGTVPAGGVETSTIQTKTEKFDRLENMMVLRNVGPFYRQTGEPFIVAGGSISGGLGVRLSEGHAVVVVRTNGDYKSIEGWLGIDDETRNSNGAYFFSIYTDNKEVPSLFGVKGGANKVMEKNPDFELDKDSADYDAINDLVYMVNTGLYEKEPILISGPILPASYPKFISPAVTDITGALTVTFVITWVEGEPGDYPDLTAVLGDFIFVKK